MPTTKGLAVILVLLGIFTIGCGGKRPQLDPNDPLFSYKNQFYSNYDRWASDEELKTLISFTTADGVDKFIEEFWRTRDTDPKTPQNEYKDLIDGRMKEVESGVFSTFKEMAGTHFSTEKNLRSDMAHVYLFYGRPDPRCYDCIQRLTSQRGTFVDLMVWYYVDQFNKVRYRFLFYEKYGRIRVFKNHTQNIRFEDLFNPFISPLKEISNHPSPSPEQLYELWIELETEDPAWIFRNSLLQFSSYSDVLIENGKAGKTFGALDSPEPVTKIAARYQPTIFGQPSDLSDRVFLYNSYNSFIPALFRIGIRPGASSYLLFRHGDLDWEIISDKEAVCSLQLRISFQNKATREIHEFLTLVRLAPNQELLNKTGLTASEYLEKNRNSYFSALIERLPNNSRDPSPGSFADLGKNLKPGTYVVNVDLRHAITKKSAGGWQEEITIQ